MAAKIVDKKSLGRSGRVRKSAVTGKFVVHKGLTRNMYVSRASIDLRSRVPINEREAIAQIDAQIAENKASLDALSKL